MSILISAEAVEVDMDKEEGYSLVIFAKDKPSLLEEIEKYLQNRNALYNTGEHDGSPAIMIPYARTE